MASVTTIQQRPAAKMKRKYIPSQFALFTMRPISPISVQICDMIATITAQKVWDQRAKYSECIVRLALVISERIARRLSSLSNLRNCETSQELERRESILREQTWFYIMHDNSSRLVT